MSRVKKAEHVTSSPEEDEDGRTEQQGDSFRQDSKKWMDYAAHRAKIAFGQGKERIADELGDVADVMREGAAHLEETERASAPYLGGGAERMERMRDTLKKRDADDLMEELSAFARRYPRGFLLVSSLAGFSLLRLLRSIDYRTVDVLDTENAQDVSEPMESSTSPL